jgi:hypothetical protein
MPILTQRSMLLAKIETTQGTDAVPVASTDSVLVFDPAYSVDVNMVERAPARRDFSNFQAIPGRTTASMRFAVEIAGSGTAATAPRWSRLLRGCGFQQTVQTSGTARTIAVGGAARASNILTVTTGANHGFSIGQSVTISGLTPADMNGTFVVASVPSATTFTVANTGTNASNSVLGQAVLVAGEFFQPRTDSQESLTLYLFHDGLLHRMTGAMGTFSISAEASNNGRAEFTFTGNYLDPSSSTFPTGETFPDAIAPLLEFAGLTYAGANTFVANAFRMDIGNNVVPRLDMNSSRGIRSYRIAGRSPTLGFDPETEASQNWFQRFTGSNTATNPITAPFQVKFGAATGGNVAGQTIQIDAPAPQLTGVGYQDRDNFRTYDLSFALRRGSATGNDEVSFLFI